VKSRKIQRAGHVARMGQIVNAYKILVAKPFEKPRRRWEDNIKLSLQKT
jgi:hypothetical protein